tara:strand:+ start:1574 stop:2725 length:1152 start_codon:yes stop_codon:yes gene_type:complete
MINFLKIFVVLFLIFWSNLSANPKIDIKTGILVDFHSDEVLYELEPDQQIYPASMTKIMTTIIVFDLLKKGTINLDDKVTISENAWRMSQSGYSSMFIMVNDEVTIEDLLRGIIVASGNDACVALAEAIAGSEEIFADMMNEKAAEIGMLETNFANSSGINDPDNYSTVRDIALMSKYLIKEHPDYYEMYKEKEFTWEKTGGDPISQMNRNRLLFKNIGADGIKTGYLAVEKYSLASSVKRETRRLISVASGFNTKSSRTIDSIKLINWGYRHSDTFEVSKKEETKFKIKTWLGKNEHLEAVTKEDIYVTVGKKDARKFKVILEYEGPIKAPVNKDQQVAKLNIFIKDDLIKTVPLYSVNEVKKINFFKSVFLSLNYMIWGDV